MVSIEIQLSLSKRSKEYHGRKAKHIMDGNNDSETR